jgi:hypothetical protein
MASTQVDAPEWFDNQYLDEKLQIGGSLSDDEIRDLYGFTDGLFDNRAPESPDALAVKIREGNYLEVLEDFSKEVDEESLRYEFRGNKGNPDHIGKKIAGHRKSRSRAGKSDVGSPARKNPTPQSSRSGSPHINVDRLEEQDELGEVEHLLVEDDSYAELHLQGEVEALEQDRIKMRSYEDVPLKDLRNAYGEPFNEKVNDITQGEKTVNNGFSTITYDELGEEA